eukprot:9167607-Pyramimonas_sp.AAC.1
MLAQIVPRWGAPPLVTVDWLFGTCPAMPPMLPIAAGPDGGGGGGPPVRVEPRSIARLKRKVLLLRVQLKHERKKAKEWRTQAIRIQRVLAQALDRAASTDNSMNQAISQLVANHHTSDSE